MRVLTTVIGGAARELADCGDDTEVREIVDEVCGILIHLDGAARLKRAARVSVEGLTRTPPAPLPRSDRLLGVQAPQ